MRSKLRSREEVAEIERMKLQKYSENVRDFFLGKLITGVEVVEENSLKLNFEDNSSVLIKLACVFVEDSWLEINGEPIGTYE